MRKMAPSENLLSECLRQEKTLREEEELRKATKWLERLGLKDRTEALIIATQAGPKHKIHKGRGLPHQTGPQVQAVQRRP